MHLFAHDYRELGGIKVESDWDRKGNAGLRNTKNIFEGLSRSCTQGKQHQLTMGKTNWAFVLKKKVTRERIEDFSPFLYRFRENTLTS